MDLVNLMSAVLLCSKDPSRKSDDEGEPRSPTDVYSSDDDKVSGPFCGSFS